MTSNLIKISESQRIEVSSFKNDKGELYIGLRKFYKTKTGDSWLPTKQGVTLPVQKCLKLRKALKDEEENINDRALLLKAKSKSKEKD